MREEDGMSLQTSAQRGESKLLYPSKGVITIENGFGGGVDERDAAML